MDQGKEKPGWQAGQQNERQGKFTKLNPNFNDEIFDLCKPETFKNHFRELASQPQGTRGFFLVKPANAWVDQAKSRPIPMMLFSEFWFEGELCILFADTNLGKSILAVQIGDSISRGYHIPGFRFEAQPQKVLYFDFEMGDKQFEARYSVNFQNHYQWNEKFLRAEVNPESDLPKSFQSVEEYINHSIEDEIRNTGAKVLIVDNLTYLRNETEKAKDALPLMKHLKSLKSKYQLSILALAHTPKRDLSKPLTRNDLQGSKMLINFCDSSFAIGENSQDSAIRYLKQIKSRNTEIIYDTDNVISCHINKPDSFLKFEFMGYSTEREHLKQLSENEKSELEMEIKSMMLSEPNISAYAIAKRTCKDETKFASHKVKVIRIVKKIGNSNN